MRKMILVPIEIYDKYFPKAPVQSPPDIEAKMQQQALFLHEMPVQKPPDQKPVQLPINPDFIEHLSVRFRLRARLLVSHLEENSERIQWSDAGELVHHGQVIANSNVADLIYDLVKPVSATRPAGSSEFLVQLKQTNVPREYITNKARVHEMDAPRSGLDEYVVAPLDDFPALPQTPKNIRRPVQQPIPERSPIVQGIRKRRQSNLPRWNPY